MNKCYSLEEKPDFQQGEVVSVDFNKMGLKQGIMLGTIVGKSITGILDQWLIDFHQKFPAYPYHVISIQHTFIIKE